MASARNSSLQRNACVYLTSSCYPAASQITDARSPAAASPVKASAAGLLTTGGAVAADDAADSAAVALLLFRDSTTRQVEAAETLCCFTIEVWKPGTSQQEPQDVADATHKPYSHQDQPLSVSLTDQLLKVQLKQAGLASSVVRQAMFAFQSWSQACNSNDLAVMLQGGYTERKKA